MTASEKPMWAFTNDVYYRGVADNGAWRNQFCFNLLLRLGFGQSGDDHSPPLIPPFNVYARAIFDQNSSGKLLSRITYDSEQVANSSSGSLVTIVREGAYIISLLGVMIYTSWQLSLVLFIIGPIIAVLIRMVSKNSVN